MVQVPEMSTINITLHNMRRILEYLMAKRKLKSSVKHWSFFTRQTRRWVIGLGQQKHICIHSFRTLLSDCLTMCNLFVFILYKY